MKRKIFLAFLGLGALLLVLNINNLTRNFFPPKPSLSSVSSPIIREVAAQVRPAEPQTIIIPKIGVQAQIDSVGLDESGNQPVPSEKDHVSWFNLGVRPGEIGSAVLAGHNVWTYGPAVFYRLPELTPGDKIEIIDANGQTFFFTVSEMHVYDKKGFPLEQVYTLSDRERLNLITCTGQYDTTAHDYSQRLVIYTVLDK